MSITARSLLFRETMNFKEALRSLALWKNGHARVKEKPAMDMDGTNSAPASVRKPRFVELLKRLTAPGKIRQLVKLFVVRAHELFDSSFRAKVLFPVVCSMALAMAVTFHVVSHRITQQSEQEARSTLATASVGIRSSQDFRRNDLLLRFHNLPNEPLWRQVFQFGETKDLHSTLSGLMQMQRVDILFYASNRGKILDVEKNDPEIPVTEFEDATAPVLQLALRGDEKADTVFAGGKLYDVITIPAYNLDNEQIGVLTLGSELGGTAAQEFSKLAQSQVALMANGHVVASTLPGLDVNAEFVSAFEGAMPANNSDDPAANVKPVTLNGVHYYCIAGRFPSLDSGSNLGYVLLSSREQSLAAMQATQQILTGMGCLAIMFCVTAVWLFINRLTEPLRELRHGAEAVGRGDFDLRVPVRSRDECGQLALVFNGMTENIQQSRAQLEKTVDTLKVTQEQLVQSEKLSAIGKFVAGVAHELNNPLMAVVGFSEILKDAAADPKNRQYSENILNAAIRCKRIVQSLLSFARREQSERKLVSINKLIETALEIVGYSLRTGNIEVVSRLEPKLPMVLVDTSQIQQVLLNIINNAQEAITAGGLPGKIQITTESRAPYVRISIQDNGPGIPREHLRRLFDPFFTTKEVGKGTGLGLSLCYGYIKENGGTITPLSQVGKGATFLIELPIAENADAAGVAPKELPEPAAPPDLHEGHGKRVLIIDDEEPILNLLHDDFVVRGYEVEVAGNGQTALSKLEENHFDLAFCDWRMPGLTGQQVYEQLRRTNPRFCERVIFITGDVINAQMRQFLEAERRPCLTKPFSLSELHSTVEAVLKAV
ncbi:MAG TPA: ATP-binding protein [Candidatus Sulfotelmatobacter sp.]|nr:ATP-binding protein [Candidatus Sulfotelmatobacter sp.]